MNCRRLLTLLVMFILGVSGMLAQTTTTGAISGNISDPSGAAVVGAAVLLTNDTTGAKQTSKSGPSGGYRFDLVSPGPYTINVEMAGPAFGPHKQRYTAWLKRRSRGCERDAM